VILDHRHLQLSDEDDLWRTQRTDGSSGHPPSRSS
jgi:hypothetical protein